MQKQYEKIIALVKDSGKLLIQQQRESKKVIDAKKWTTEYDQNIENEFARLIQTFPGDHSLYAEELHVDFVDKPNVWIVDPISYTYKFTHNLPHYAIVVSHIQNGEIKFACIYDHSMNELFTAQKGQGAYLNSLPIHINNDTADICILYDEVPVGQWTLAQNLRIKEKLWKHGWVQSIGSFGLHYAYVAAGRAQLAVVTNKDTFPEFAGKLLVEEAGGVFTDFNNQPLTTESRGIIAGNNELHAKIQSQLRKIAIS